MKIEDVQRKESRKRTISLTIRITEADSKFMKDNSISPTAVFNTALEELKSEK